MKKGMEKGLKKRLVVLSTMLAILFAGLIALWVLMSTGYIKEPKIGVPTSQYQKPRDALSEGEDLMKSGLSRDQLIRETGLRSRGLTEHPEIADGHKYKDIRK